MHCNLQREMNFISICTDMCAVIISFIVSDIVLINLKAKYSGLFSGGNTTQHGRIYTTPFNPETRRDQCIAVFCTDFAETSNINFSLKGK